MDARDETALGITGGTRILGLIADPVVQARSPAMATALLRRHDRFGRFVLVPMETPAAGLVALVAGLRVVGNFAGAIVSMPHKAAIVPLLDELTPVARTVGAVNVVRRSAAGRLEGTMLVGEGFVLGLREANHDVRGAACLVAGAGGAASAIAFALAEHGCASLAVVNRTRAKAADLVARIGRAFPGVALTVGDDGGSRYDLAVNATSLGMRPTDPDPFDDAAIRRSALVADCVVAPESTRLLERAAALGRLVHPGLPMLRAQMALMLRFMGVDGL